MKKKCSLLINSCDSYSDTWDLFFSCFSDMWGDCPFPIYLNTETKNYKFDSLNITCLNGNPKWPWGKRLKEALKKIDTEYILFMLDDFFITNKVDQKLIDKIISWMENDKNISVFCFNRTKSNNIRNNKYDGFELRPQKCDYKLNCQAAIWRRKDLIRYIRNHESPWDFELLGSKRASRYTKEFYSIIAGLTQPISYNYITGGGIHRGKWVKSEVLPLAKKYNLDIDFESRGFLEEELTKQSFIKKNKLFKRIQNRLKYMIKKVRSII